MPHNMSHKNYSAIDENRMSIVNKQQKNIFLHFFFSFMHSSNYCGSGAHWGRPSQQRGQLFCGLSCPPSLNEGKSTVLECIAAMLHVARKSEIVCMQFHSHFPPGLISSREVSTFSDSSYQHCKKKFSLCCSRGKRSAECTSHNSPPQKQEKKN